MTGYHESNFSMAYSKMCSLYLSLMDRFDVKLDQFGDSQTRLVRL